MWKWTLGNEYLGHLGEWMKSHSDSWHCDMKYVARGCVTVINVFCTSWNRKYESNERKTILKLYSAGAHSVKTFQIIRHVQVWEEDSVFRNTWTKVIFYAKKCIKFLEKAWGTITISVFLLFIWGLNKSFLWKNRKH